MKKIIFATFVTILLLSFSMQVMARDNFAYAAGIQDKGSIYPIADDFDSMDSCLNAMRAYQNAGYNVSGHLNPTKQTLWENLYASVQFFMGHASTQHINFKYSGIIGGIDRVIDITEKGKVKYENVEFIGTNNIHWDADTILVTYAGCNTAGTNGIATQDTPSITRTTVLEGATGALGFKDTVNVFSLQTWCDRYNQKLGEGYAVNEAQDYANSFSYISGATSNVYFYTGNKELRIGKYGNNPKNIISNRNNINLSYKEAKNNEEIFLPSRLDLSYLENNNNEKSMDERNILSKTKTKLSQEKLSLEYSKGNLSKIIKNVNPNFNEKNYQVEKVTSETINAVTNEVTDSNVYYNYNLKIGDFVTDAAYTVKVNKENQITAIYDNNIDLEKQEKLLEHEEDFIANISNKKLQILNEKAKLAVSEKYDNKIEHQNQKRIYYYDINTNKKYILIDCKNELILDGKQDNPCISVDRVMYEI